MMGILRLILIGVVGLIPSALFAQPPADGPASVPFAATHLRESIPDVASAVVSQNLRSSHRIGWSATRKGAVVGLVAGGILGAGTGWLVCQMDQPDEARCAGTMFLGGLFFGGIGAGAGAGLGALIDSGHPSISHGTRLPRADRSKRVSVSFRF